MELLPHANEILGLTHHFEADIHLIIVHLLTSLDILLLLVYSVFNVLIIFYIHIFIILHLSNERNQLELFSAA